ncbi:hypothetical protein Ancab_013855 [Ancistrocladus abbreviatus]
MANYQERRMECYEYREYGSQPYQTYSFSEKSGDGLFGSQGQTQLYKNSSGGEYGGYNQYKTAGGGEYGGYNQYKTAGGGEYGGYNQYKTSGGGEYGNYDQYQSTANRLETQGTRADTVMYGSGTMSIDPFFDLVPSSFPPGTDQKVIDCFNRIDKDRNGLLCDKELQSALSSFSQSFSMRTVHLLMYIFTSTNTRVIGPKEFVPLMSSLQSWKATFQRFDRNRNGSIDASELKEALYSLGFAVPVVIVNLLVAKFDKSGVKCSIQFDNFIECCLTIKGLTEKFKAKDCSATGTATFTYEEFLLSVLPFIIA